MGVADGARDERSAGSAPTASAASMNDLTHFCGSVPVRHLSPSEAVDHTLTWIREPGSTPGRTGLAVHFVNAWTVVLADQDESLRSVLTGGCLNLPDGISVVWNARRRGYDVPRERVRGPQYFLDVLDRGRGVGLRHYLLGGTEGTLAALRIEVERRFPGVLVVGAESPPFRALSPLEVEEQDARIAASGAEVVWLGLGSPKQEFEAHRIAAQWPVVAAAVGAAFDFTAGTVQPAPVWMQRRGLEWAYRLSREPRRLWRRYLIGNARFLAIALRRQG